jgi:uncharacterized protein YbjT (DUF2867 family)
VDTLNDGPRSTPLIAVAGATGYIGTLIVQRMLERGYRVIGLARGTAARPAIPGALSVPVDVRDIEATTAALTGVDAAYYLIHAMAGGVGFASRDRQRARAFGEAARRAGVRRIIYLGALGRGQLSEHLASRQEVGDILRESGVAVVELRAAVILGTGSLSFEMLRSLTERLPVMVCPVWVSTRLQPLAESDLLDYLEESLTVAPGTYEIGTPDVTNYGEMMQLYARVRGLAKRRILTIPMLTPKLSARWVDLVSPVDRVVSHALIESLVSEVIIHRPETTAAAFTVRPMTVIEAIRRAIDDESARVGAGLLDRPSGLSGGVYTVRASQALPPDLAPAMRLNLGRVGGDLHWYGMAWGWRLRLLLGRLLGERLALHRPARLTPGAEVDWWTVVATDPSHLVLATRGWRVGDGWLGYRVAAAPSQLDQVAAFRPKGLLGLFYWWGLTPVHRRVFGLMAQGQIRQVGDRVSAAARAEPLAGSGRSR